MTEFASHLTCVRGGEINMDFLAVSQHCCLYGVVTYQVTNENLVYKSYIFALGWLNGAYHFLQGPQIWRRSRRFILVHFRWWVGCFRKASWKLITDNFGRFPRVVEKAKNRMVVIVSHKLFMESQGWKALALNSQSIIKPCFQSLAKSVSVQPCLSFV